MKYRVRISEDIFLDVEVEEGTRYSPGYLAAQKALEELGFDPEETEVSVSRIE